MFIDKLSFMAEFNISGHFINDALTTTDLDALGMTGKFCRGSSQNITIFPPKKLSVLVITLSILPTANISRPHPILLVLIRLITFLILC